MRGNSYTGSWIPAWVPQSSAVTASLLVFCSIVTSSTFGYDGSMLNGLNILPSYTDYFKLTPAILGLQTASIFIGGCIAGLTWGYVVDWLGRRVALFWAAIITLVAVILQTAAVNTGMFTFARILVGFGTTASGCAGPPYLAETLPLHWRGWGLGFFNDAYYVGGFIAAGITYGTAKIDSTWAWRAPSAIQAIFSIICIVILPFVPESPRWLTYANGDQNDPIVLAAFKEVIDTLEFERNSEQQMGILDCFKTPSARRRILLASSAAVFSTIAGNVMVSYYLGGMLTNAGVTSTTTQLEINIVLNAWSLVCAVIGTLSIDKIGRKPTALASQAGCMVFIFIVGGLTKVYGTSTDKSGIYGTVASIFFFMGAYSFGWTPILYMYPPEVLNMNIRATGVGVFQFVANAIAVLMVFTMPIAIESTGYKIYMANGAWDAIVLVIIFFTWVETKGKTLEELDEIFDGAKHTDVPDLEQIYQGNEGLAEDVKQAVIAKGLQS